MSDLTERLFKHANDTINDWQGTADDWEAYARRTDAICAEAAVEIDRLTRELAEARDKALEEAANAARERLKRFGLRMTASQIYDTIVALKEKP